MKIDKTTNTVYQYDYDPTGENPDNLIIDEIQTVSTSRHKIANKNTDEIIPPLVDKMFFVPKFAPFSVKNLVLEFRTHNSPIKRKLELNVDYSLSLRYKGATEALGVPIYGAISLNNLDLDGVITMTYQTLGGPHIVDRDYITTTLIERGWNPRTTSWDYITNIPEFFPPLDHDHNLHAIAGVKELTDALKEIGDKIAQDGELFSNELREFFASFDVEKFQRQMMDMDRHTYTSLLNDVRHMKLKLRSAETRILRLEMGGGSSNESIHEDDIITSTRPELKFRGDVRVHKENPSWSSSAGADSTSWCVVLPGPDMRTVLVKDIFLRVPTGKAMSIVTGDASDEKIWELFTPKRISIVKMIISDPMVFGSIWSDDYLDYWSHVATLDVEKDGSVVVDKPIVIDLLPDELLIVKYHLDKNNVKDTNLDPDEGEIIDPTEVSEFISYFIFDYSLYTPRKGKELNEPRTVKQEPQGIFNADSIFETLEKIERRLLTVEASF